MPDGSASSLAPTIAPPRPAAAILLAWRNLAYDRARFVVTMVGVTFAVVLVAAQAGLFFGFTQITTAVIEHTGADLWVALHGLRNFEITMPMKERNRTIILGVPGVARAEALCVFFTAWRKPQGGYESVLVVGFDPNSGMAGPWNLVAGDPADLRLPDAIAIDDINKDKLGIENLGDTAEISQHRARVVGFTHGIRSFTTSPYVFASFRNAINFGPIGDDQANYVIVKLAKDADPASVAAEIRRRLPAMDVLRRADFSEMTKTYWMFTTGAGTAILVAAGLGLVVGMVIVAQVLYATTIDHLVEFATLRAMGAPQSFITAIILWQAAITATLGYAIGIVLALVIAHASQGSTALIVVPPSLAAGLFVVTFAMCAAASLISIRKVMTLDPAMVFQR
jgi:putative ABC transport system permease protein